MAEQDYGQNPGVEGAALDSAAVVKAAGTEHDHPVNTAAAMGAATVPPLDPPPESAMEVYVIAGLGRRLLAFLLDLAAVGIASGVLRLLLPVLNDGGAWFNLIFINSLFLGVIGAGYFILMTRLTGQTLGKMIMGIRVVRTDGAPLNWSTVIIRELVGRSISQLLGSYLGYLTAWFTVKRQAPHDMIADTYVVYDYPGHSPREIWLPQWAADK